MDDKLLEYLIVTDQLDDFLGFKDGNCPNCGDELVEILYGRPTPDVYQEVEQKKLYLGGCVVGNKVAKYHCYGCGKNFYEDGKEAR